MAVRGVEKLTHRKKEILWLLLEGHDAKSAARQLSISVHTVNEHLRDARRTLGVSSSREAARLLRQAESGNPNSVRSKKLGVVGPVGRSSWFGRAVPNGWAVFSGVTLMIVLAAAMAALSMAKGGATSSSLDAPPKVVATKPSAGAMIAPGPFVLTVTFDRPMLDGNYSFVQMSPETYPSCEARPTLSADARTFTLRCTAQAGHAYEVWFNRPPYMNFKSTSGASAEPHHLSFRAKYR
jgi:DNA-binding CsgD family transcriptional regulator